MLLVSLGVSIPKGGISNGAEFVKGEDMRLIVQLASVYAVYICPLNNMRDNDMYK